MFKYLAQKRTKACLGAAPECEERGSHFTAFTLVFVNGFLKIPKCANVLLQHTVLVV